MFQDYSIDDYKKACYIILRPDLTPEYFIRHFGMSRYEYSICQQRLKELQKFYGIEYHFEENRIHWTVTDEKQFQQHYKGMWSFYNRHRRNLTNRSELVRGLYIARKILLANDHTDLDAVSETMVFSRSNLRNAIKLCRTFLQSYNIRLENAPHYGVYPMGNEWNIRRCLMAIYSLLDVNVIPEEDYPEIAEGLSNPHYPVLREKVYEALLHNSCNYSQAQVRRLTYYIFFQHLRIRQGRIFSGFENIHPAIIGYVRNSERLMKISADITRSCFGGEAFSEQEILSVAMMLFEMYDEPEEFCAFVEATFPEEANDLYRMVDGYLLRSYGFSITGLYSSILRTTLYRLIIHHQMGLLSEHAGHSESRAQMISDYPLVMLLYQNIQQLLAERYGNEAAGICCAPLCELIAFYIQGMDYAAPRLRIGITARSDIYAPEMIRNLLLAKLNPQYYSSVECCTYDKMTALYSAYDNTTALISLLQMVYHNVKHYFQTQIDMQDVNQVLAAHFNDFGQKVVEAYIRPLKIKDSVPKYRVPIQSVLRRWEEDDTLLMAMANEALRDKRGKTLEDCRADLLRKIFWIEERYDNLEKDYLEEIDTQVRRYTRAATQKIENLTNRDQSVRGNLNVLLTTLSRNRRAAELVDQIQPAFQLYEQSFLSEKSLWYRKRPEKRTKTASVLIQDDQAPNTEEQVRAAQLLQSKYGRAAVNAYVQGWLGDADIRCSEELSLEEDKDYIMSLLAILGSKDASAGYVVQELDGIFCKNGYSIPQMQIRRKEKKP